MQEIVLNQREIGSYVIKFIQAQYRKYKTNSLYWAYNIEVYDTDNERTTWRSYHEDKGKAKNSYYYFCKKVMKLEKKKLNREL